MQNDLSILIHAPEFTAGDERAVAAVRGFERASSIALAWRLTPIGRPVLLPDRDQWLIAHTKHAAFPLLCNGNEAYPVTINGFATSAILAPGGQPLTDIYAELPLDQKVTGVATEILGNIADGARAYWGTASPGATAVVVAEQTIHPEISGHPRPPPRVGGLPGLKQDYELSSPEIPGRLGWLNYWSPAAAAAVGFPDPIRDAELLTMARRTPAGAWIVQLTEAPLHVDIPAHLDALRQAYERFPVVGGRAPPRG